MFNHKSIWKIILSKKISFYFLRNILAKKN